MPVTIAQSMSNCYANEYGVYFDVMGPDQSYRHMSVYAKARLGWPTQGGTGLADPSAGSTSRLTAVEEPPSRTTGPRGIKIRWSNDANDYYYVESRTPRGFDRGPAADDRAAWLAGDTTAPDDGHEGRLKGAACSAPVTGTDVHIRLAGSPDPADPV